LQRETAPGADKIGFFVWDEGSRVRTALKTKGTEFIAGTGSASTEKMKEGTSASASAMFNMLNLKE